MNGSKIPNMAMTISSFNISIEPLAMKYMASRISPGCMSVSPGGACVDLNRIDNVRRQPVKIQEINLFGSYRLQPLRF